MDIIFMHMAVAQNLRTAFSEQFELQLNQIYRSIKALGCDYFYFLGVDTDLSYRFCTHEDWMDIYYNEEFILNDPLKRLAENTSFLVLPWQQISYLHGQEKRTMDGRIFYGLNHGLTIAREYQNRKYIFSLATELKEHDLARYLLLEKINVTEQFIQDSMSLFDKYLS